MAIDFESFLLCCLRRRPADQDWIGCIGHAVLGLTSAAVALLALTAAGRPSAAEAIGVLTRFEYARALLYHHVDARPVAGRATPGEPGVSAVVDLACRTGRVSHLVDAWTCGDLRARADLGPALDDFEMDRARTYAWLHLEPVTVWAAAGDRVDIRRTT